MSWFATLRSRNPGYPLPHLLWWEFMRLMVWCVLTLFYRHRWWGEHNVPSNGHVLLVCNHQSFLDLVVIGVGLPRHFHSMARSTLFRGRFFTWLIRSLNAFSVDQSRGDTKAIRTALEKLDSGHLLLVFPEGTRSSDGALHRFRDGALLLVRRAKCPVVPMAVEGVFDVWPVHGKPKLRGHTAAMYGTPIPAEELLAMKPAEARARIEAEVEALRLKLRAALRHQTNGRYPQRGPGDHPAEFVAGVSADPILATE
ncbi:MAG: hypothetical protein GC159_13930 [Phycisphaera sp.]|nr:hypothetical protein [Phycisphaera sp.]